MALFISGLFTGMAVMLGLGYWLNEREKKRKKESSQRAAVNYFFKCMDNAIYYQGYRGPTTLEQQLQSAIEREDFKEAARIRDLMNKQ
jgi:hypothetical protein